MCVNDCYNFYDFCEFVRWWLLGLIFNYIDGVVDDEVMY